MKTTELRLELPPPRLEVTVTPEMLAAGRAAFLRKRKALDDLWCFFDDDLTSFLRSIYVAMRKECDENRVS